MPVTINGTTGIAGVDGSAGTPAVQGSDTNTGVFFPAADTIAFGEGGTEVMRITSAGNVGIGTTTPAVKLDVVGAISASGAITAGGAITATGAIQASGVTTNLYPIVSGTAQNSTSGTSIDFTGIPSWVKRITIMLNGVSSTGTDNLWARVGSGSFSTTGYSSANTQKSGTTTTSTVAFIVATGNVAATTNFGHILFTNITGNTWVMSSVLQDIGGTNGNTASGSIALSGSLDRVQVLLAGANTFDAGSINILYE